MVPVGDLGIHYKSGFHSYVAIPVPATPLKLLSPSALSLTQVLDPVTPERYSSLCADVVVPASLPHWKLHCTGSKIYVYRLLAEGIPDEHPPLCITHILSFVDGKWQMWVHGKLIMSPQQISFPATCTSSSLEKLLGDIDAFHICEGVTDSALLAVVNEQVHQAFVDDIPTLDRNNVVHKRAVRDVSCELLISGKMIQCQKCANLKERLRSKAFRESSQVTTETSKFNPNIHLSTPEKLSKLAELAVDKTTAKKRISSLSSRIQLLYTKSSVAVDAGLDEDLATIMTGSDATKAIFPEGSFQKLFWEEQKKAVSCKDPHQRRWHPLMIKWCLNLRMISSAAYHNMRSSGMLVLPSERTLRDYSNVVKAGEGFSLDVFQQLFDEARQGQDSIPYHRRFVYIHYANMRA